MTGSQISIDATLELLANPTRRQLLWGLREVGQVSVDKLVADFDDGMWTNGGTNGDERHNLEATLRHVHLPKLADADVIDYDPVAGTIGSTEHTGTVTELLETVSNADGRTN